MQVKFKRPAPDEDRTIHDIWSAWLALEMLSVEVRMKGEQFVDGADFREALEKAIDPKVYGEAMEWNSKRIIDALTTIGAIGAVSRKRSRKIFLAKGIGEGLHRAYDSFLSEYRNKNE